jgi:hypothetical protein
MKGGDPPNPIHPNPIDQSPYILAPTATTTTHQVSMESTDLQCCLDCVHPEAKVTWGRAHLWQSVGPF